MTIDIDKLRKEVRRRYTEATAEDARRYPTKKVPDFRSHGGVQVTKMSVVIDATDADLNELAEQLAQRAVEFEHGLIEGAGGDRHVARCFLKGYELPDVFPVCSPDLEPAEDERGMIKCRHVFGAVCTVGVSRARTA